MASSVMDRPDEGRIHQLAVRNADKAVTKLHEHIAKEKSRVVAVERHDGDWRDGCKRMEERFLWFKARDKTTVQQIKESYRSHYGMARMKIILSLDHEVPDDSTPLAKLNKHNDQCVVFTTQSMPDTTNGATSPLFEPSATALPFDSSPDRYISNTKKRSNKSVSFLLPHETNFQEERDSPDPPNIHYQPHLMDYYEKDNVGLSMDDFLTEEQKTQLNAGHNTAASDTHLQGFRLSQDDESGYGSNEPMTVNNEARRFSFGYKSQPTGNQFRDAKEAEDDVGALQTSLQQILQESVPERLEAAVKKGVAILSEIEEPLLTLHGDADAKTYLEQIAEVRNLAKRNRTVLGVVGNTGAGKSSVINAVLDEERLVPTNCMRACTAVVTELSYNDSSDASAAYRAEIEFVQPEEWERELTTLFREAFDQDTGLGKEANNPDTVAGVSYAKIRAVYPNYTREMLQKSNVRQLMNLPNVKRILGNIKHIESSDCASFYQLLQRYVDSQQKSEIGQAGNKIARSKREIEFWPLIKVVRIYTKAKALATGATIVDLPGVQDSNAARAAVAEGYMKECSGLWIVAPISRAVNDKAAKNLLGNTFRRQLKYDGTYSAVTFICSKTDDISRTEAESDLNIGDVLPALDAERASILQQKSIASAERERVRKEKDAHDVRNDDYDDKIVELEDFVKEIEGGESLDSSESPEKKRKLNSGEKAGVEQILTIDQAKGQIDEQKRLKKVARQRGHKLREELMRLNEEIIDLEARESQIDNDTDALCIKGRNDESRRQIREDFAEGVKELDQENAAQDDPDNFDPQIEIRDYKEVARSLPVFCVSSRAYQKLSGRLQKDSEVAGFTSLEQTEIPQLQAHCRKLTESGRLSGCKEFLNSLNQLLASIALWSSDDSGLQMSDHQRTNLKQYVTKDLQTLQRALKTTVRQTMEDAVNTLGTQLVDYFLTAADNAAREAVDTAIGWGAPREQGGLFWATYKATVRRQGVFEGASGSRNFNVDLTEPLYKELGTLWEKTFQRRLPGVFQHFPKTISDTLKEFHSSIDNKCKEQNVGLSRIARLRDNLPIYDTAFADVAKSLVININEAQREINREFTPCVAAAMAATYSYCAAENGRGSFFRMKQHMETHISSNHVRMFENATSEVKDKLHTMCNQVRKTMRGRVDRMFQAISRDYMTIVAADSDKSRVLKKSGKTARREVDELIAQTEALFKEVLDSDLEKLDTRGVAEINGNSNIGESAVGAGDVSKKFITLSRDGIDDGFPAVGDADETVYGETPF